MFVDKVFLIFLSSLVACQAFSIWGKKSTNPEQIHISYGDSPSKMIVTWNTMLDTETVVKYGVAKSHLIQKQTGSSTKFTDGGNEKREQYVHKATLSKLKCGVKYYYMVGSDGTGWSDIFYFYTMKNGSDWSPRLAIFGDMGLVNAQSLSRLEMDAANKMYDALLHVGDFAYDLDSDNARVGDAFMNQVQPLVANLPYMTCVGNHESNYNFLNYKSRFNMPGDDTKRMYYSFNMGPIHFISLSTEFLYYPYENLKQINEQYKWIESDLKEANKPKNRKLRPWIITFGHRPMYCSNKGNDDCAGPNSLVRTGVPLLSLPGLEELFLNHGVDLSIWAHEHSYERLWPIYDTKVMNGSTKEPYTNPKGITHIITGSAGCKERVTFFTKDLPEWSAFHSTDYGYSRLTVLNSTHLHMEQVSDDQNGKIIDKFTLIKTRHEAYKRQ